MLVGMLSKWFRSWRARRHHRDGCRRWSASDLDGALRHFQEATQLDAEYAEAWYSRGWILAGLGRIDEAERDWTQAIEHEAHYVVAYVARAWARFSTGRFDDARKDLDDAIRINPSYAPVWFQRAELRLWQGDHAGSVADFSRCLSIEPGQARALQLRAFTYFCKGDPSEAINDYSQAMLRSPSDTHSAYARGLCQFVLRRWELALSDFADVRKRCSGQLQRDYCLLREWMVDLLRQRSSTRRNIPIRATEAHLGDLQDPWVRTLGAVVLGEANPSDLIAWLEKAPAEQKTGLACQAGYHLGFRALLENQPLIAQMHFEGTTSLGAYNYLEHALAANELAELKRPS